MHASRLLAAIKIGRRQGRHGHGMEWRFLLSLPRLEVRFCRTSVQRRAGTDQSRSPPISIRRRYQNHHRRRHSGSITMAVLDKRPVTGAGPFNGVLTWIDTRFPLIRLWEDQWGKYV